MQRFAVVVLDKIGWLQVVENASRVSPFNVLTSPKIGSARGSFIKTDQGDNHDARKEKRSMSYLRGKEGA